MCGIVGGVGNLPVREYLIKGLKTLDYRGYDSAGLAFADHKGIHVFRTPGRVADLDAILPVEVKTSIGIGHTRWATHGAPTEANAHPHTSMHGEFVLVHNGVIENYRHLKNKLESEGYTFSSETDTEVIANLLEDHFKKTPDVLKAIYATTKELQGSYALAIMVKGDLEHIYFAKNRSPLVLGQGTGRNLLASDFLPMLKEGLHFTAVLDHQYGFIAKDKIVVYDETKTLVNPVWNRPDLKEEDLGLQGYPHYMLKEIEESPAVIRRLIDNYFDGNKFLFDKKLISAIKKCDDIIFIACGTSYHACLVGRRYAEYLGKRAEVHIASEWAYHPLITAKKPLFIIVSQSGETADLIRCLEIINARGATSVTITNTKGSTLEREATFSLLLFAGVEIAVASTKAYIAQVALLALLTSAPEGTTSVVNHLYDVIKAENQIIAKKDELVKYAKFLATKHDVFFLGRGYDYDVSLEASLKLKEITYIHSEGLPGGELKHGPIALIEKDTPVIGFISDQLVDAPLRSNLKEVEARGAHVIAIVSKSLKKDGDSIVVPDVKEYLAPLTNVVVAQYLAYFTALELKVNIDKPRNLAKSVTVE